MVIGEERVDTGDVRFDLAFGGTGKPVPCGASRSTEPDRPQESILRQRGRAENLGQPSESDSALELHLPEAILGMHIAETEKRIELCRSEHVRNRIDVPNDFDRRRRSEHFDRPIQNRKGPSGIDVGGHESDGRKQDHASECFPENTHGRIIPITAVFSDSLLKQTLDRLYADFNYPDSAADPIQIVRRYERPDDREVVGFCAAALAFGRVASVLQSIERLTAIAGPRPADYVRTFEPSKERLAFSNLVHRWTGGPDLVALLWIIRQILDRSGSIEDFFLEAYEPSAPDVTDALESFSVRALGLDLRAAYGRVPRRPMVHYFFPRPSAGSGCKRLNLFLRWMVRRDALDLGVWSRVAPAKLIVPLDTHVIRVGRCLRLTRYTSPGWAMARDITATLSRLDPEDPVKYDFALCHLGMMNACGFNRAQADAQCPLRGACRPRVRKRRRSLRPSVRR
jgi:uncharacterized protein (TIGR02757 family)